MIKYNLRQQVFCINWISGIANRLTDTQEKLQQYASHHLRAILANREIKQLIGEWQVVWGPAICKSQISPGADNTILVAKTDPNIYVIGVAGSNPSSLIDPLEAMLVEQTVRWPYGTAENNGRIPLGTKLGLDNLLQVKPPNGEKLLAFLHSISQQQIELHVTGSSLGGALSATLALALFDQKNNWDPNGNATIKVLTVAGATPGDANFARYYDSKLGDCTERVWNQKDVVPHVWEQEMLAQIPDLYSPQLQPNELIQDIVADLRGWSNEAQGEYQQICQQTPGFPSKIDTKLKVLDKPLEQVSQILAHIVLKKFAGNHKPAQWLVDQVAIPIEAILKAIIDRDSGKIISLSEDRIQEIVEPHLKEMEVHLQQHKGYLSPEQLNVFGWLKNAISWLHSNLPGVLHFFGEVEYQHIDAYMKHMGIEHFDRLYHDLLPYSITYLSNTSNTVTFEYTCPDNPAEQWEWWALYEGSVPEYKHLGKYLKWSWICPEKKGCQSSGTKTVEVGDLTSGATYSLALFKWRWDVVDFQEFTVEPQYELKRQILCFNRLCDSLFSGNEEENKDTEKNLNDRAIKKLIDFFADPKVQQLIGQWTLVWGPVIYHKHPETKAKRDNLMYVVQKNNTNQYAIAIAGTSSNYGWLEEDFTVDQLEDWASFLQSASLENQQLDSSKDLSGIKISQGTSIGLGILMNQMKYGGQTLMEWLHNQMKNYPQEEVEIIVTGHSLGGALSPSLALALVDLEQQWNLNNNAKVFALPTAGATAGNREFALHYNEKLEKSSRDKLGANRIWNQIDMVPHAWETDLLDKVPTLYQKYGVDSNLLLYLAVGIAYDDSINFLRESKIDWQKVLSSLSKVFNCRELFAFIFHEKSPYEQICKKTALSFLGEFQQDEAKKQAAKILNNRKNSQTTTEILSETKIITNLLLKVHGKPEQADMGKLLSDLENLIVYPALEVIKSGDDSGWSKTLDSSVKALVEKHSFLELGIFTVIEELALEKVLVGLPVLLTFLFQAAYQHVSAYVQYYNIHDYVKQLKEHGIVEED